MKRKMMALVIVSSLLGITAASQAATGLTTSAVNMGLGSLNCRVTNITASILNNVSITILDGNNGLLDTTTVSIQPGRTVALLSASGAGTARCVFAGVTSTKVRANGGLNNGNLAADGVILEAR